MKNTVSHQRTKFISHSCCQIPPFYMKNETDAKSSVIDTNVTKRQEQ